MNFFFEALNAPTLTGRFTGIKAYVTWWFLFFQKFVSNKLTSTESTDTHVLDNAYFSLVCNHAYFSFLIFFV